MLLKSVEHMGCRGEVVFSVEPDPVLKAGISREQAGGGGMGYEARRWLAKYSVGHCMTQDASKVDRIESRFGLQF